MSGVEAAYQILLMIATIEHLSQHPLSKKGTQLFTHTKLKTCTKAETRMHNVEASFNFVSRIVSLGFS